MTANLITTLLHLATNLLPSIIASAQAHSSSSSNSNNSENERAFVAVEDFERLIRTLEEIKATLSDAKEREIRDHSVWLEELKKVTDSSHKRQQIEELSILSDLAMAEEIPETALMQEIPDASLTKALLEKLTQLVLLQQTAVQQPPLQHAPATEGLLQSSPISVKLDGANYAIWSQAAEMYIKGCDKLKHIKGDGNPPRPGDPLYQKWDIDDSVVKGWLLSSLHEKLFVNFIRYPTARDVWDAIASTFNNGNDTAQVFDLNKRVARLKQSGRGVEEYYNELQTLWREIDFRRPNPMIHIEDIEKFNGFIQETRVYTFLDGLDDRLDNVRADVLQMSPFPTVEQAYARVRREATRQEIMMKGGKDITHESVAMVSKGYKQPMVNLSLNKNISSLDKSKLKCTYCGGIRHVRKNCFKLTGNHPDWWKEPKKKFSSKGRVNSVNSEKAHADPNLVSSASIQYPNSRTSQPMQSTMQHGSSSDPEVGQVGTNSASAQCVAATGSGSGSLRLTSDIKNMDQILEEEEVSIQALGTGNPPDHMSGDEMSDEDLLDY
ncbi:uncharacterized protein LOC144549001 isoform X4 [Carex rostrata]